MLAIFSALIGLLGSLAPGVIGLFQQKQTNEFELEIAKVNATAAAAQAAANTFIETVKADVADRQSVRLDDMAVPGNTVIQDLKASIRPVVTYLFFGLFLAVKSSAAYVMIRSGSSIPEMLQAVWDDETSSLFAAIMAFWFGNRAMERYNTRRAAPQIKIPNIHVVDDIILPKFGEKSDIVGTIQQILVNKGYSIGVDGDFGDETKDAITSYQKSVGLPPTGELDAETHSRLIK